MKMLTLAALGVALAGALPAHADAILLASEVGQVCLTDHAACGPNITREPGVTIVSKELVTKERVAELATVVREAIDRSSFRSIVLIDSIDNFCPRSAGGTLPVTDCRLRVLRSSGVLVISPTFVTDEVREALAKRLKAAVERFGSR